MWLKYFQRFQKSKVGTFVTLRRGEGIMTYYDGNPEILTLYWSKTPVQFSSEVFYPAMEYDGKIMLIIDPILGFDQCLSSNYIPWIRVEGRKYDTILVDTKLAQQASSSLQE